MVLASRRQEYGTKVALRGLLCAFVGRPCLRCPGAAGAPRMFLMSISASRSTMLMPFG
jgi:hypothetical protein